MTLICTSKDVVQLLHRHFFAIQFFFDESLLPRKTFSVLDMKLSLDESRPKGRGVCHSLTAPNLLLNSCFLSLNEIITHQAHITLNTQVALYARSSRSCCIAQAPVLLVLSYSVSRLQMCLLYINNLLILSRCNGFSQFRHKSVTRLYVIQPFELIGIQFGN